MKRSLLVVILLALYMLPTTARTRVMRMGMLNGSTVVYVPVDPQSIKISKESNNGTTVHKVDVDGLGFHDVATLKRLEVNGADEIGYPATQELRQGYLYMLTDHISRFCPVDAANVNVSVIYQQGVSEVDIRDLPAGTFIVATGDIHEPQNRFTITRTPPVVRDGKGSYWFAGLGGGATMAFGDDSYNVFTDAKEALGYTGSVHVGRQFSHVFGVRLNARYAKLYSRVSLETLSAFGDLYPKYFPRNGFYGYEALSLHAEAMVNLVNLFSNSYKHPVDFVLIGGVGCDNFGNYDRFVGAWSQSAQILPGGWYEVDTAKRTLLSGTIGGMLSFNITPAISIDLEAIGTVTGDSMEGVVYEEPYDVYITGSVGMTFRF